LVKAKFSYKANEISGEQYFAEVAGHHLDTACLGPTVV